MPTRLLIGGWVAIALLLPGVSQAQPPPATPPPAQPAEDDEARRSFEVGRRAYEARDYETALSAFERSYELSGRPLLLHNIGTSLDRLRRDREAVDAFERYLQEMPDAPNRAEVETRMAILREQIARAQLAEQERERNRAATADASPSVLSRWWFWTGVVLVVAGAIALTVVLTSEDSVEAPLPGTDGNVIEALRWP